MEQESDIVSLSLINSEQDHQIISRIQSGSKKIFKIVYAKPESQKLIKYEGYNRKEKSLQELSKKFINEYIGFEDTIISLDVITKQLGVERRRIYDIINILESLRVVKRRCKNKYHWSGFKTIYTTIEQYTKQRNIIPQKREKSLEVLSCGFLQLFIHQKSTWTLEEAARKLGTQEDERIKTRVRRLYDIANVLKSIGLITKIQLNNSKKPAFKWIGIEGLRQFQIHHKKCQEQPGLQEQFSVKVEEEFPERLPKMAPKDKIENRVAIGMLFEEYVDQIISNMAERKQHAQKSAASQQQTEQKLPSNMQNSVITPKLKRTYTIIAPRQLTPVRTTPRKSSRNVTPVKPIGCSLMQKFNENI